MGHAVPTRADECSAFFPDPGTPGIHETDQLHASLPGEKLGDVLLDNYFSAGDLAFAGATVLFDYFGEVFGVINVKVVEIGGWVDVAGHAEIHYKQGAI